MSTTTTLKQQQQQQHQLEFVDLIQSHPLVDMSAAMVESSQYDSNTNNNNNSNNNGTGKSAPALGMLIDRTSFDHVDDFGVDKEALESSEWSPRKQIMSPNGDGDGDGVDHRSAVVMRDGKVRRRLRWRPKSMMKRRRPSVSSPSSASSLSPQESLTGHRSSLPTGRTLAGSRGRALSNKFGTSSSNISISSGGNSSQMSRTSKKSMHSFASTETMVKSNTRKGAGMRRFPLPRPNYPKSFDGVSTIGNEGNMIHARMGGGRVSPLTVCAATEGDTEADSSVLGDQLLEEDDDDDVNVAHTVFDAVEEVNTESSDESDNGVQDAESSSQFRSPTRTQPLDSPLAAASGPTPASPPVLGSPASSGRKPPLFRRSKRDHHSTASELSLMTARSAVQLSQTSESGIVPSSSFGIRQSKSNPVVEMAQPDESEVPLPSLSADELEGNRRCDLRIRTASSLARERRDAAESGEQGPSRSDPLVVAKRGGNLAVLPIHVDFSRQTTPSNGYGGGGGKGHDDPPEEELVSIFNAIPRWNHLLLMKGKQGTAINKSLTSDSESIAVSYNALSDSGMTSKQPLNEPITLEVTKSNLTMSIMASTTVHSPTREEMETERYGSIFSATLPLLSDHSSRSNSSCSSLGPMDDVVAVRQPVEELRFSMSEDISSRVPGNNNLRLSKNTQVSRRNDDDKRTAPPSSPNSLGSGELSQRSSRVGPTMSDSDSTVQLDVEKNLQAIHDMATEHLQHGEYAEASDVFEEILRGQLARYGGGHFRVGTAYHNIGIVSMRKGDYAAAILAYREAVRVRKKALGAEHADVAVSLAQLGVAYLETQSHRKAICAFREALKIRRQTLGNRHPKVAKVLNNLGCALYDINELEVAMVAFEEALDIQRELLRDSPIDTLSLSENALLSLASTQSNIASIKLYNDRFDEAAVDLEEVLLIQQCVLGDDHPIVQRTRASLRWIDATRNTTPMYSTEFFALLSQTMSSRDGSWDDSLVYRSKSSLSDGDAAGGGTKLDRSRSRSSEHHAISFLDALERKFMTLHANLDYACGGVLSEETDNNEWKST